MDDFQRTQKERMANLDRHSSAWHGTVRHIVTALIVPITETPKNSSADLLENFDPEITRQSEIADENIIVVRENARGWGTERVDHLKICFDIRSLDSAEPQTGYRDLVSGICCIVVKGRKRGQTIRLATNEWNKAQQLGDSYWLYVVWDPLGNPGPVPLMLQDLAKHLEHAAKPIVEARYYDILAEVRNTVRRKTEYAKSLSGD